MLWIIKKQTIPKEIATFMDTVFEICEARGRVGQKEGISFYIRSNEANHTLPHLHARYGEYNIEIEITDVARVLAGNLPNRQQKKAQEWVKANKEQLINDWSTLAISATTEMTKSLLNLQ